MASMISTTSNELIERYDLFLLDAYGVLTTSSGAIDGAKEFLKQIRQRGKIVRVLSNDCSRTRENAQTFYLSRGYEFEVDEIFNAGFAITHFFSKENLRGQRCAVLGTDDTKECVRRAGGIPVEILKSEDFNVIVIGDDSGFETLPTMNAVLTTANQRQQSGKPVRLITANPDLLYQKSRTAFGFTSGSLAHLLLLGLKDLNPGIDFKPDVIGKPSPFLYELALASSSVTKERAVMIGDQLATDILGANLTNIDSCLIGTGLTSLPPRSDLPKSLQPKLIIDAF